MVIDNLESEDKKELAGKNELSAEEVFESEKVERPAPQEIKKSLTSVRERVKNVWREFTGSRKVLKENLKAELAVKEKEGVINGVDFSYCQLDDLMRDIVSGQRVEIEPGAHIYVQYAADLLTGEIEPDKMSAADHTGLELAGGFRKKEEEFAGSKVINVFFADDIVRLAAVTHPSGLLNPTLSKVKEKENRTEAAGRVEMTEIAAANFRQSYDKNLRAVGAILPGDREGQDYKMIFEGDKEAEVDSLVKRLEELGRANGTNYILRDPKSQRINFVNSEAENPLYQEIELCSGGGNWQCVALDAATFLKEENLDTTHLVVLPLNLSHGKNEEADQDGGQAKAKNFNDFKEQQHQVWEILRILGIDSRRYHNIFYDETLPAEQVMATIFGEMDKYRQLVEGEKMAA